MFYEAFGSDAKILSAKTGLTKTKDQEGNTLCGFPIFQLNHWKDKIKKTGFEFDISNGSANENTYSK